jgi:hypothetical protein
MQVRTKIADNVRTVPCSRVIIHQKRLYVYITTAEATVQDKGQARILPASYVIFYASSPASAVTEIRAVEVRLLLGVRAVQGLTLGSDTLYWQRCVLLLVDLDVLLASLSREIIYGKHTVISVLKWLRYFIRRYVIDE